MPERYKMSISRPGSPGRSRRQRESWRESMGSLNIALGLEPPPGTSGRSGDLTRYGSSRSHSREQSRGHSRELSKASHASHEPYSQSYYKSQPSTVGHSRIQSSVPASEYDMNVIIAPPPIRTGAHPAPPPAMYIPSSPLPPPDSGWKYVFLIPSIVAFVTFMFVVTMAVNNCPKQFPPRKCVGTFLGRFSFQPLKENPLFGPSSKTLLQMGGLQAIKARKFGFWRLGTSMWLHSGVFHLISNAFGLCFIGWRLEKEFGPIRVGALYFLAGLGGAIMSAIFLTNQVSVGASGAVFGLLGATTSELITNWFLYENRCAALGTLFILITINIIFGLMPFIDNFAHIGGLVAGFFLGFILLIKPTWAYTNDLDFVLDYQEQEGKQKPNSLQTLLRWFSFVFIIVLYAAGLTVLFAGFRIGENCSWCKYMSCVPTAGWECNFNATLPNCQVVTYSNGTGYLLCPSGQQVWYNSLDSVSLTTRKKLCIKDCLSD